MQTFLPFEDYAASAAVLDRQRLGKQRVETMQVLSALTGYRIDKESGLAVLSPKPGWQNHPVATMWRGREHELLKYQEATCSEWTGRGYRDSCLAKSRRILEAWGGDSRLGRPEWLTEDLQSSHRAALLFKDPDWYSRFGWVEEPVYEYVWPHQSYPGTML